MTHSSFFMSVFQETDEVCGGSISSAWCERRWKSVEQPKAGLPYEKFKCHMKCTGLREKVFVIFLKMWHNDNYVN